jgi:hypothetical protein
LPRYGVYQLISSSATSFVFKSLLQLLLPQFFSLIWTENHLVCASSVYSPFSLFSLLSDVLHLSFKRYIEQS